MSVDLRLMDALRQRGYDTSLVDGSLHRAARTVVRLLAGASIAQQVALLRYCRPDARDPLDAIYSARYYTRLEQQPGDGG